jgi:hypothetical protein
MWRPPSFSRTSTTALRRAFGRIGYCDRPNRRLRRGRWRRDRVRQHTSTSHNAIDIDQAGSGASGESESIFNAGVIKGAGDGILSNARGTITNNGTIYGGNGVQNWDRNSGDTAKLYNHGAISGGQYGVYDQGGLSGGHVEEIYNSGAIDGGTYAVYADKFTPPAFETLVNYATGTLSGGVFVGGPPT